MPLHSRYLQVDFLPDGHYQQDSITLEDQQRRMELFNAAVDSYIAGTLGGAGPTGRARTCSLPAALAAV